MNVPLWLWGATIALIVGMIVFDFVGHVRKPHDPTLKESAIWSAIYVAFAVVFGIGIGVFAGPDSWTYGGEYLAGWLTEKALSVDNLFVFLLIMTSFKVPRAYQQKVLLIGIVIAIVMRGAFIALGAVIIEQFVAVFYLFGAFLFVLAYQQIREATKKEDHHDDGESKLITTLRRVIPTSQDYDGDKLRTKIDGKKMFTPMFLVILAIGFTDLLFAFDSIPAIFGITQEPYLVFTANAFALLGLRQLYFLIGGLLERLIYLSHALSIILAFIGVKLVLHALHENNLPFINGGQPLDNVPEIPIWLSLLVIAGTIAVAAVASIVVSRRRLEAGGNPEGASASVEGRTAQAPTEHAPSADDRTPGSRD